MALNTAIIVQAYNDAKSRQLKYDEPGGEIINQGVTFKDSNKNGELDSGDKYVFGKRKGNIANIISNKEENPIGLFIDALINFFN